MAHASELVTQRMHLYGKLHELADLLGSDDEQLLNIEELICSTLLTCRNVIDQDVKKDMYENNRKELINEEKEDMKEHIQDSKMS